MKLWFCSGHNALLVMTSLCLFLAGSGIARSEAGGPPRPAPRPRSPVVKAAPLSPGVRDAATTIIRRIQRPRAVASSAVPLARELDRTPLLLGAVLAASGRGEATDEILLLEAHAERLRVLLLDLQEEIEPGSARSATLARMMPKFDALLGALDTIAGGGASGVRTQRAGRLLARLNSGDLQLQSARPKPSAPTIRWFIAGGPVPTVPLPSVSPSGLKIIPAAGGMSVVLRPGVSQ